MMHFIRLSIFLEVLKDTEFSRIPTTLLDETKGSIRQSPYVFKVDISKPDVCL